MYSEFNNQEMDQSLGESTCKESPKVIQAIKKNAVHQICSGQVVLNLAIAVKELVENSLDAGATSIEVRLKEYGSKLIEVVDNGCGVEETNFQGLTLKHHTSKLQDFSDLVSVETFGFRGEALSSLCALSEVTVITRHVDASCGTKLEFDHRGQIVSCKPFSRQVGTSVTVCNLFASLPVRQKEFHRNLRREFTKMTHLLFAYCLVSVNVKITCSNQVGKGGRTTVVSTPGSPTVRENIASVFGAKQVQTLMSVSSEEGEGRFRAEGQVSSCVHGQGRGASDRQFYFVNSRPCEPAKVMKLVNEVYRTYNPHQYPFVFLNVETPRADVDVNVTPDKRQVFLEHEKELLAVVKALLQNVYEPMPSTFRFQNVPGETLGSKTVAPRSNGRSEQSSPKSADSCPSSPAVSSPGGLSAMFGGWKRSETNAGAGAAKRTRTDAKCADGGEKKLGIFNYFKRLKSESQNNSLSEETEGNSLTHSKSCKLNCSLEEQNDCLAEEANHSSYELSNQELTSLNSERLCELGSQEKKTQVGCSDVLVDGDKEDVIESSNECFQMVPLEPEDCVEATDRERTRLVQGRCDGVNGDLKETMCACDSVNKDFNQAMCPSQGACDSLEQSLCPTQGTCAKDLSPSGCYSADVDTEQSMCPTQGTCDRVNKDVERSVCSSRSGCDDVDKESASLSQDDHDVTEDEGDVSLLEDPLADLGVETESDRAVQTNRNPLPLGEVKTNEEDVELDPERPQNLRRRTVWSSITLDKIRNKVKESQTRNKGSDTVVRFRAGVDPTKNQSAEQELGREIAKHMFSEMRIIGQFNLGFIITRLDQDLFIIDQHASDEKYNFETLQQRAALSNQRLVCPLALEVSATGESVLIDNADIFRTNGFEFDIDETAEVTKRVMLTAIPVSRNWEFGKEDIDELIFMLQDAPGTMCRPSRVRAMFASRACRKSVMIGTALSQSEMRRLVNNMGTIEQPWNCPHGRPTMRHLVNLDLLQS